MSRKVEEVFLAYLMEHYYSKDEIITMYLNTIIMVPITMVLKQPLKDTLRQNQRTFNLSQAAVLAGIPQAPSYFNPVST